jgi:glycosyltransferase involved in cell wall biosynthesis
VSARPSICVLQVAPFDAERAMTGAQVVTAQFLKALAAVADVTVLHGFPPGERRADGRHSVSAAIRAVPGFPLDEEVARRGHIAPRFTPEAESVLREARVLVTEERTLAAPPNVPRVACLGGLGYSHSFEVVDSGGWDRLVLPSPHALRLVQRHAPGLQGVVVIENGVDLDQLEPAIRRQLRDGLVRLLVPARADPIKGALPALELGRALGDGGCRVELSCLDENGLCGRGPLYDQLQDQAGEVETKLISWRDRRDMPAVYHAADLTVCFSGLPEGFGLAALESVVCGTPVLAWPAGFLAEMLPPGHGLYLLSPEARGDVWLATARLALAEGSRACLELGRPYARQRYAAERMALQYRDLIVGLA